MNTQTIHHNTLKRAARFGIELRFNDDMYDAIYDGRVLSRQADSKVALAEAEGQIELAKTERQRGRAVLAQIFNRPRPGKPQFGGAK
jgi:hypothetical protein